MLELIKWIKGTIATSGRLGKLKFKGKEDIVNKQKEALNIENYAECPDLEIDNWVATQWGVAKQNKSSKYGLYREYRIINERHRKKGFIATAIILRPEFIDVDYDTGELITIDNRVRIRGSAIDADGNLVGGVYGNWGKRRDFTNELAKVLITKQGLFVSIEEVKSEEKIKAAIQFKPALILNKKTLKVDFSTWGWHNRTIIGSMENGEVIIAVIKGIFVRKPSILDCIEYMQEKKVVNACNLDGGSRVKFEIEVA